MEGEYLSLDTAKKIVEKDKEIERLNNIIEEYKNANEYHQNIIHELETMKQPNQLHSENIKLRAENNRLNNIIEEYKNANEYHQNIIHELETMKQPNQLHSENIKLRAENNRLNNIINKAIEILDIYGTSNYETADLLYSTLRGSDKE